MNGKILYFVRIKLQNIWTSPGGWNIVWTDESWLAVVSPTWLVCSQEPSRKHACLFTAAVSCRTMRVCHLVLGLCSWFCAPKSPQTNLVCMHSPCPSEHVKLDPHGTERAGNPTPTLQQKAFVGHRPSPSSQALQPCHQRAPGLLTIRPFQRRVTVSRGGGS